MSNSKITKVNVYRGTNGAWYGARWAGEDYDGCDALECSASESASVALAAAALEFEGAEICRVADVA